MTKQKMTQRRSGPVKKTQLYASLWASCDELRGGMDASQYKDYVLALLFIKYVSDKYAGQPFADIEVPEGASFDDLGGPKGGDGRRAVRGRGRERSRRERLGSTRKHRTGTAERRHTT